MKGSLSAVLLVSLCTLTGTVLADEHQQETSVEVFLLTEAGNGEAVGSIHLKDTEYGLLLTPALSQLTPGIHGFHVHANGDCGPAEKEGKMVPGLAAGGHFDPGETGKHEGPYGDGHLGDLPPLVVNKDGTASLPVLAPRVKVKDIQGKALMIHVDGDNFSDEPKKLGGGGARKACGVIGSE